MRRSRSALYSVVLVIASSASGVALSEAVLRALGNHPWVYSTQDVSEPSVHQPDPVLGWSSKPGRYTMPSYAPQGSPWTLTFMQDGSRATGSGSRDDRARAVILGCSFTLGWGVSDAETYAWKLQDRFPEIRVQNHGTAGYGTYQSLLELERLLAGPQPPKIAVYGFIDHHEDRNVATDLWMQELASYSRRGHVYVPYVTLGAGGALVRHAPEEYLVWPLAGRLAFVNLLEEAWLRALTRERRDQKREVTRELLVSMSALCRGSGTSLLVALLRLDETSKRDYMGFCREHHIDCVDCARPLAPEDMVPGDNHPNVRVHTGWAECIARAMGPAVDALGGR